MNLKSTLFLASATLGLATIGATNAHADELYTVKAGDTLSAISTTFTGGVDAVNKIAQDNGISDINLIFEGQQLNIVTDGSTATTTDNTTEETYTEQPADDTDYSYDNTDYSYDYSADTSSYTGDSSSAKEWIAQKESGGSYSATNGQYIGRYQLTDSYLNGDYSAENQERVADQYVAERYGSWEAAQQFWMNNGWY